jgi:hypothetical protein
VVSPSAVIAASSTPIDGAMAHSSRAAAAHPIMTVMSWCRSRTSPSGTISTMPAA